MAELKTEKATQDERPVTEAQIRLIKALYEETGYERMYAAKQLVLLSREQASRHVQFLKEYKIRDQALRAANDHVPQFDKIGLGMLYKLYITEEDRRYFVHRCTELGKVGAMCEVYDDYKTVQAGVRKHVQESVKP